jgi:hypothetical protein
MNLTESEFAVLRQTIASRGTARIVLFPATVLGWAALAAALTLVGGSPATSLFSLAVLASGFEAIHALHAGVERIGRYLQVFYESHDDGPKWETTAITVGPAQPRGGVDPQFTPVFAGAVIINLIPALLPAPTRLEMGVVGVLHFALLVRLVRARGAAARQRAVELESYRAIKSRQSGGTA